MNLRSSRRAASAVAAAALALGLSACGGSNPISSEEDYARDRNGAVATSAHTPPTFVEKAAWSAKRLPDAPVIITSFGLLTFSPDTGEDTYSAIMLDAATGQVRWASRAVSSPEGMPQLAWVEQDDRPWVTITTTQDNKASVYTYDPMIGSLRVAATTSVAFEGKGDKAPTVVASDGGMLVLGAKEADAMQYRPQQRATTVFGTGPTRHGDQGVPMLVHNDGFFLTFPRGGFAYASDNGGWDSARIAPDGVDRARGTVLAVDEGFILVQWPSLTGDDGNQTLWLHSLQNGEPLVEFDADDDLIEEQAKEDAPLVVSSDDRALAWGEVVFDLNTREGKEIDLHEGVPAFIHSGILYVRDAESPFPFVPASAPAETGSSTASPGTDASTEPAPDPSDSPEDVTTATPGTADPSTASPQSDPSSSASPSPDESSQTAQPTEDAPFHGFAALRLEDGKALRGEIGMVPMGFSTFGYGVFAPGETEVYSVALR